MKITKRQLKRIIKEEKKRLNETFSPMKSIAHPEMLTLIREQSTAAQEGVLLADLSSILDSIGEIANGMYGLQDPGEPGLQLGDEMAGDLELQVERLNSFFTQLETYFEMIDDLAGRNPGGSIG